MYSIIEYKDVCWKNDRLIGTTLVGFGIASHSSQLRNAAASSFKICIKSIKCENTYVRRFTYRNKRHFI